MSTQIHIFGKSILDAKNVTIAFLYDSIIEYIEMNNVNLNPQIELLLEHLELASDGIWLYLDKYIHSKDDLIFFAELVKNGIEIFDVKSGGMSFEIKKKLEQFYKQLLLAIHNYESTN